MKASLRRIYVMFLRYLYLHKRSMSRTLELIFWPVMQLLVWGFVSIYLQQLMAGSGKSAFFVFMINAIICWDIFFRSQMGISTSFMEDIWTQNIINLLVSPLRVKEWVLATFLYGLAKTAVVTVLLSAISLALYKFNIIGVMGLYMVPLFINLLLFGMVLGLFSSGLLIRWGHSVEILTWGLPFLIQPLSAVFYPVSVLPAPLRMVSQWLPSTYVFEGIRTLVQTGTLGWQCCVTALALNAAYLTAAGMFFSAMYHWSRKSGRLGKLGMD